MSNSADGRPPPPRRPAPQRYPEHDAYADPRYVADPRTGGQQPGNWAEPAQGEWEVDPNAGYAHGHDDFDPRTGPAAFEFQPSPLQPRNVQRVPTVQPTGAGSARGRLPEPPESLRAVRGDSAQPAGMSHTPEMHREQPASTTLSAPSRARTAGKDPSNAAIVPAGSVTGRSLTLVVAIMCFLACLTAGAVYLMNQSANAWLRDIASEVTVQLEAREKVDIERELRDVTVFLGRQPGIAGAKPLSLETSAGLLEPWLGQTEGLKNLPVPRLIAVEIDRANPPDFDVLRDSLKKQFKGITLDDHRHWQRQIRTVTRSFALGGLAILILVGAATTAIGPRR